MKVFVSTTFLHIIMVAVFAAQLSTVQAADTADHDLIGFSQDGRWFAFREFGVHDGSGYPYARLFVVDTANDTWAKGTPVRVTIEHERKSVTDALVALDRRAAQVLSRLGIRFPARTYASNPIKQTGRDDKVVGFQLFYPYGDKRRVRLETMPMASPADCFNVGSPLGLRLIVEFADGRNHVGYEDRQLPESRGCALDYSIAELLSPASDHPTNFVAMIYVFSPGFEGRDINLMAIPFRLPE